MHNPFLIGKKLYLRGLEKADLEGNYLKWLNDPEVTRFMFTSYFPYPKEKLEEYYRSMTTSDNNVIFAIVDKETDKHIGNIRLGPIDWIHRVADIGYMIGEKDFWGKGYTSEAVELVLDYAFSRLNLHKVRGGMVATHKGSLRAAEKGGLRQEGFGKAEYYRDGTYYDYIRVGICKEDFYTNKAASAGSQQEKKMS